MAGQHIQKFRDDLTKKLHEQNAVTNVLEKIEKKTGVDRFLIIMGLCALAACYLIFGYFAELMCNCVGLLYPAYLSIKAIESVDKADDTQWLTYWVVFGIFSVIEFASDAIVGWFPLYWLAKCLVLLYLHLPFTCGAQKLYERFIRPFVLRHESAIDRGLDRARQAATEIKSNIAASGDTDPYKFN